MNPEIDQELDSIAEEKAADQAGLQEAAQDPSQGLDSPAAPMGTGIERMVAAAVQGTGTPSSSGVDKRLLGDAERAAGDVEGAIATSKAVRGAATEALGAADASASRAAKSKAEADVEQREMEAPELAKIPKLEEEYQAALQTVKLRRQQTMQKLDFMEQTGANVAQMQLQDAWVNTSPIGAAFAALGAGLGALAGSVQGRPGANPFLETMNAKIAQDLQMQRLRIEKAQGDFANQNLLLNQFMKVTDSLQEAEQMAHVAALDAVSKRINYLRSMVTDKDRQAMLDANAAALDAERAARLKGLTEIWGGQAVRETQALASMRVALANASRTTVGSQTASVREKQLDFQKQKYENAALTETMDQIRKVQSEPDAKQASSDIYTAGKALDILEPYKKDLNKVPNVVKAELVQELAKIAGGGVGSDETRRSLDAQTYKSQWQAFLTKVQGEPTGAQLGEFIKLHKRYLEKIRTEAKKVLVQRGKGIIASRSQRLTPEQLKIIREQHPDMFEGE